MELRLSNRIKSSRIARNRERREKFMLRGRSQDTFEVTVLNSYSSCVFYFQRCIFFIFLCLLFSISLVIMIFIIFYVLFHHRSPRP